MGLFAKMFAGGQDAKNMVISATTGRPLFEATAAACAYVGGIDGDWDDDEKEATSEALSNHPALVAFDRTAVNEQIDKYAPLAVKFGGRKQLLDQVSKFKGHEQAEAMLLTAVDVAIESDGICQKELKALKKLGEILGVSNKVDWDEIEEEVED